ncbi:hypothetical protein AX17_000735 [Amanita inopinata Kibby_2008]|nr:hypothetical protein AX17_000735 [Amanita inopinata Kibby_2008]
MIFKASILALVAPLVHATINIQLPTPVRSASSFTVKWTSDATDPGLFSFELNNEVFHNSYAIANNVQTTQGSLTIALPIVPIGGGYTLQAVNITNINDVYGETGQFNIEEAVSSSEAPTRSGSAGTVAVTTRPPMATTGGGFGTTMTGATNAGGAATGSAASGSGTASSAPTGFNNGATSKFGAGSYAAMALSGIAGVAMLAL